jgi:nucleoside-diphosphate-sugar epimerase
MRVLLTGASGFVGRAALVALQQRGAEVIAVSRTRPEVADTKFEWPKFAWQSVDLLDHAATANIVTATRPDAILHLAWTVEHGKFWTTPSNLDWVAATLNLARAAATAGVARFIGTGTCYEYDWPATSNCKERHTPLKPALLYGTSKDATRRILEEFGQAHGLSVAWARLFFLYGPGEGAGRLVPSVASALAAGQPAKCSSGTGLRDFMDVRDVGAGLAALALSNVTGPVNVASGQAISIADIARTLGRLAGRPELVHIGALPDRPGEPPRIVADITRLRDDVGFVPSLSLDQGLAEALDYWKHLLRGA